MGVNDYDLNPDNNTQINGINIAEGCPPSGINNAIRQVMADVKEDSDAQNTAIEALKKKAETAASAENLGPVKVGDGLSIGEDGTLSLDLVDAVDSTSATQAATANAVKMAYDKAMEAINMLPVGSLIPSFAASIPGCLLGNGAAVSRTTYKNLFAVIGTAFGSGDGSTTFNLPDFRNKTLWGANGNLMAAIAAGLPNIRGKISQGVQAGGVDSGAFYRADIIIGVFSSSEYAQQSLNFDASRSDKIYGNSTTVQPPAIGVNIFIKY